jgi:thiol-disulfide isomerase/thioredoxin
MVRGSIDGRRWCNPCKMLSPVLERLTAGETAVAAGTGRALDLVTVDTDAQGELAQKYNVCPCIQQAKGLLMGSTDPVAADGDRVQGRRTRQAVYGRVARARRARVHRVALSRLVHIVLYTTHNAYDGR